MSAPNLSEIFGMENLGLPQRLISGERKTVPFDGQSVDPKEGKMTSLVFRHGFPWLI